MGQCSLHGPCRCDNVDHTKTKNSSPVFWLSYKEGSEGQYLLYDPSEPTQ